MVSHYPASFVSEHREEALMNLVIWLPAMFLLGVVAMGLCYLFMKACERI